jgi:hypothetical protein
MHITMRYATLVIAASLILAPASAFSQPSDAGAPPAKRESRFGGYFGAGTRISRVKGATGAFVGGEFVMLIDHRFAVGFGGYGLATDDARVDVAGGATRRLSMGYGGLRLGYIAQAASRVHPTFDLLIGDGEIGLGKHPTEDDDVFVLEPAVGVEAAVARMLRVGAGVSYRYVGDVGLARVSGADLRALSAQVVVRVGRF